MSKFDQLGIRPVRIWKDITTPLKPAVYSPEEAKLEIWLAERFGWGSPTTKEIMDKVISGKITVAFARKIALTY